MPTKILAQDIDTNTEFTFSELALADGSAATPALSFSSDPNLGLYRIGNDEMGVSAAGGNLLFRFGFSGGLQTLFRGGTSAGLPGLALGEASSVGFYRIAGLDQLGISAPINIVDGTVSVPSYSFANDLDTGIYRTASNSVGVSQGGVLQWEFNGNGTIRGQSSTTNLLQPGFGSVSTPGFGFTGDEDTGFYRPNSNQIAVTAGGTEIFRFLGVGGGLRPATYSTNHDGGFGEAVTQNQSTTVDYTIGGNFIGLVSVVVFNNVNTAHGTKLFWVASSFTEFSFTQLASAGSQAGNITVTNPSGMTFRVQLGATGSNGNKVQFLRFNTVAG